MKIKSKIADAQQMSRAITRLSHEIIERNKGASSLCVIGIRTRGDFLAKRIADKISDIENLQVPLGTLDITLYRDDVRQKLKLPELKRTEVPFDITDKQVVLVDDVLFTGRTIRSAMDALIDIGRPNTIQLAVLVETMRREGFELTVGKPQVVTRGLPVAYLPHGKADDILHAHGLDGPGLSRSALAALGVGA